MRPLPSIVTVAALTAVAAVAQSPARVSSPCERACEQMVLCQLQPYAPCVARCRRSGMERTAEGLTGLEAVARMSCEELSASAKEQRRPEAPASRGRPPAPAQRAPPPPSRPQRVWQCTAKGVWEECPRQGGYCRRHTSEMFDYGPSEQLARDGARRECSSAMLGMMQASFTTSNSVLSSCEVTRCSSELQ